MRVAFKSSSVGGATSKKAGIDRGLHIWRANERERFKGSIRLASVSLPRGGWGQNPSVWGSHYCANQERAY